MLRVSESGGERERNKEKIEERERERERVWERENRMLNNSSHVHFTPFKKGIIIALEQRRVSVKEKDEEKRLCKRWRATNKRQTPRFILLPLCVVYIYKGLQALCDVLQSLHRNDGKLMPSDIKKRMVF